MRHVISADAERAARIAFLDQRKAAKRRGIPFSLTFDEWWCIWRRSGHWHRRGCRQGSYVMARYADKGAYALGNVRIVSQAQNNAERVYTHSAQTRARLSAALRGKTPWNKPRPMNGMFFTCG